MFSNFKCLKNAYTFLISWFNKRQQDASWQTLRAVMDRMVVCTAPMLLFNEEENPKSKFWTAPQLWKIVEGQYNEKICFLWDWVFSPVLFCFLWQVVGVGAGSPHNY